MSPFEAKDVIVQLTRIADALDRAYPPRKDGHVDITRFVENDPLATSYKFCADE